jgi:hypothetical protein
MKRATTIGVVIVVGILCLALFSTPADARFFRRCAVGYRVCAPVPVCPVPVYCAPVVPVCPTPVYCAPVVPVCKVRVIRKRRFFRRCVPVFYRGCW